MLNLAQSSSSSSLDQAAQGSGGVTIPVGVQNTCRCGTLTGQCLPRPAIFSSCGKLQRYPGKAEMVPVERMGAQKRKLGHGTFPHLWTPTLQPPRQRSALKCPVLTVVVAMWAARMEDPFFTTGYEDIGPASGLCISAAVQGWEHNSVVSFTSQNRKQPTLYGRVAWRRKVLYTNAITTGDVTIT